MNHLFVELIRPITYTKNNSIKETVHISLTKIYIRCWLQRADQNDAAVLDTDAPESTTSESVPIVFAISVSASASASAAAS